MFAHDMQHHATMSRSVYCLPRCAVACEAFVPRTESGPEATSLSVGWVGVSVESTKMGQVRFVCVSKSGKAIWET